MFNNFDLDKLFDFHPSYLSPFNKYDTTTSNAAAAVINFTPEIQHPVQPGEIRLHSWMLYTPQAPVLDLRNQNVTSTLDFRDDFHQLHLCPLEDETQGQPSINGRRKS